MITVAATRDGIVAIGHSARTRGGFANGDKEGGVLHFLSSPWQMTKPQSVDNPGRIGPGNARRRVLRDDVAFREQFPRGIWFDSAHESTMKRSKSSRLM